MAQLKVKQISDFVSAVASVHNGAVGTDTVTAISVAKSEAISQAVVDGDAAYDVSGAAAAALVSAVSQAESKDVARATTTATNLSNAISTEVIDRNTAIGLVNTRVTTLLGGSTAALDTFGEIKAFIDALEAEDVTTIAAISTAVSNDVVHSNAISTGISVAIDNDVLAQGYANTAEANAISTAIVNGNAAYDAIGAAAAAQSGAEATAESKDAARATTTANNLSNAISTEVIDRNAAILVLDNDLQSQINTLAGVSNVEEIAKFGTATSFNTLATFDLNGGHVAVFVNGLQVHEAVGAGDGWISGDGQNFTVQSLGYNLEAGDHIIVSGKTV